MFRVIIPASADVSLKESQPNTNQDGSGYFQAGDSPAANICSLLNFDLSIIPSDATFDPPPVLWLYLKYEIQEPYDHYSMGAHLLLREWVEAEATWNKCDASTSWGLPGASSSGVDFTSVNGSFQTADWTQPGWYSISLANIDAKSDWPAYGLRLYLQSAPGDDYTSVVFYDRTSTAYHPYLELYTSATTGSVGRAKWFLPLRLTNRAAAEESDSPAMHYHVRNASTRLPMPDDPTRHALILSRDSVTSEPWRKPRAVDATNAPGLFRLPLTITEAASALLSLAGKSSTKNADIEPALNVPGPGHAVQATVGEVTLADGQVVDANVVAIAGSEDAADATAREANAILRGAVVVSETYPATTTVFYASLPVRADGYANMVLRFDDGTRSGIFRAIASSETVDTYTKITLKNALNAAPTDGTLVSAGGSKEAMA